MFRFVFAEARLGGMLEKRPPIIESSGRGTIEKKPSLPSGIDKKQSYYAQELYHHQDIVAEVVAQKQSVKTTRPMQ